MIKAKAHHLAEYREDAGMRIHIPNYRYLQRDFKVLMKMAYSLKQKKPNLKRNIKFDEDSLGLYMDIQLSPDWQWQRVKPDQARQAVPKENMGGGLVKSVRMISGVYSTPMRPNRIRRTQGSAKAARKTRI